MIKTALLGDLVDISSSKRIFYKEYVSSGVPFYRSKEIIERAAGRNDISTELFISEERFNEIESKFGAPREGDLLLTSVGTLGIPYLVQKNDKFYFKDGNLTWFRNFASELDRTYLLYWLTSRDGKNELLNHTIGSTQKALTIQGLKRVKIPLPNIETQRKIADILGTIDAKIELNRKMNETLEQMGQALFRHYFIDNPEAEKWTSSTVGQYYDVLLGGTPSRVKKEYWEDGTVGWINSGKINEFRITEPSELITEEALDRSAAKLLPKDTTVIAITGATLGQISRLERSFAANQSVIGMVPKGGISNDFIYYWISYNITKLIGHQTGGAQQHINRSNVVNFEIPLADNETLDKFQEKISSITEKISNNCFEIQTLTALRDTLLPRLINGRVRVKE